MKPIFVDRDQFMNIAEREIDNRLYNAAAAVPPSLQHHHALSTRLHCLHECI